MSFDFDTEKRVRAADMASKVVASCAGLPSDVVPLAARILNFIEGKDQRTLRDVKITVRNAEATHERMATD